MNNVAEPGWTTTEFWLSLVMSSIGLLMLFNVIHLSDTQMQGIAAWVTTVAPVLVYAISRGIRKLGTTTTVAKGSEQQLPAVSPSPVVPVPVVPVAPAPGTATGTAPLGGSIG